MKHLVEEIARQFADHPESVSVSAVEGRRTVIFELRCDSRDVGRVIGRKGRTIIAIRALLNAIAARERRRAVLEILA